MTLTFKMLMKKYVLLIAILAATSLNSCAVINFLIGKDKCNYPNCNNDCTDNCNYCIIHCDSHYVPSDFNEKVGKSIDKQVKPFKLDK